MPNLYDPAQVERLIKTIDELSRDLDSHKAVLKQTSRTARFGKAAAIIGLLVGVLGVSVGSVGIGAAHDAQAAANVSNATQATVATELASNRLSSCIQFNAQRKEVREAMKLALTSLAPPEAARTEAQRASLETYSKAVDLGLPYRDCSAAGIEAYFKSPPKDPAGPGGGG